MAFAQYLAYLNGNKTTLFKIFLFIHYYIEIILLKCNVKYKYIPLQLEKSPTLGSIETSDYTVSTTYAGYA